LRFVSFLLWSAWLASATSYFEPNRGQASTACAFLSRTSNGTVATGPGAIEYLSRGGSSATIVFEGASRHALAYPEHPLPGVSHYMRDRDPARWIWDVPHFGAVLYREVYSGIDLRYRAAGNNVEFDFLVGPGADASRIQMRVPAGVHIDASGALALGGVSVQTPVAWQVIDGRRAPVSARFTLHRRRVSIQLGAYDVSRPLIVDPLIQFATFWGGSSNDVGQLVIAGSDGAIYLAGQTTSVDFPASLPPGNPLNRPDNLFVETAFLSRLKADASAMDWSLFIGGTSYQSVFSLKQDVFGNILLLGNTTSANFPVTPGAWRTAIDPSLTDLFVVKLDGPTGHVIASTYLGVALYPNSLNAGALLATDSAGGAYIGGNKLYGGVLPITAGAFQATGLFSQFVMRLNSAMNAAVYVSYWPFGTIAGMDVDSGGDLVIGGAANLSPNYSIVPFAAVNPLPGINQNPMSFSQAYVARLNPTGSAITFASLLDGNGNQSAISDLKLAPDGSISLLGWTDGANLPQVNPMTIDPLPAGYPAPTVSSSGPFLAKLTANGGSILQSTFFYGPNYLPPAGETPDLNFRLALLPNGTICLAGFYMFIANQTPGALIVPVSNGNNNIFWSITCSDAAQSSITLKTGLPTTGGSSYTDIAVTPDGGLLVTGGAGSTFTTTPGVVQPQFGGSGIYDFDYGGGIYMLYPGDAFLMRVNLPNPTPAIASTVPDSLVIDTGNSGGCALDLIGSGFAYGTGLTVNGQSGTLAVVDSGHATATYNCAALQAGNNDIVMTLPAPGGGTSDRVLTGINAPPTGITVSPASVTQGAAETKLVIRAENLSTGSVLYWNGSPRAASFVLDSSTARTGHFELLLEPADLAQPAAVQVTVSNPAPGGGLSAAAAFAIQPASGATVPFLNSPSVPFTFGGTVALGPQISMGGSGFTASTQIFWDGASVPVSAFAATSIAFQPPPASLAQWGVHSVNAVNGAFQSPTVKVSIGRAVNLRRSAYDPVKSILYVLSGATAAVPSDLLILDGATGKLLNTLPALLTGVGLMAVSANGQYLYIANDIGSSSLAQIFRYNTETATVDLQWQIPSFNGQVFSQVNSIVTPPDSPETLVVSSNDNQGNSQVLIFDGNRARALTSVTAGFPAASSTSGYPLFFASSTRIYGGVSVLSNNVTGNPCWIWLDYNAAGISGGQSACADAPPEVQHDSGVDYLTDGARVYVISEPSPTAFTNYPPDLTGDLTSRRAWQFDAPAVGPALLFEYNMDAQQLQLLTQLQINNSLGAGTLYSMGNGAALLALSSYIFVSQ
jgi:hypothetical protein